MLKSCLQFKGAIILGVGGCSIEEINVAVNFLREGGKDDLFLMYGFQNYPTNYKDINLNKMLELQRIFNLPVGYADHTDPNDPKMEYVSSLGTTLGINVLEKHITIKFGEKRTDAQSAINFDHLKGIYDLMKTSIDVIGDGSLGVSEGELDYGKTGTMKKAIVARKKIDKGSLIREQDVAFKRTNSETYISQRQYSELIGLEVIDDIEEDEMITFSKVKFEFRKQSMSQFFVKEENE